MRMWMGMGMRMGRIGSSVDVGIIHRTSCLLFPYTCSMQQESKRRNSTPMLCHADTHTHTYTCPSLIVKFRSILTLPSSSSASHRLGPGSCTA